MRSVANGAAVAVPTPEVLASPPQEVSVSKQPRRQFEVKQGGSSLGWCLPCFDGRGRWCGWQAVANLQPAGGYACAEVAEFSRLKTALAFVKQNGVAL